MYAFRIGNRRFRRSFIGYRRREVEDALDASARALAEAQAVAASREQEVRSREQELESQRQQIDELDAVTMLLAKRVVDHRKELEALRAEHAAPADVAPAKASLESLAGNGGPAETAPLLKREA